MTCCALFCACIANIFRMDGRVENINKYRELAKVMKAQRHLIQFLATPIKMLILISILFEIGS